jgi:hypothetical protein
MWRWNVDAGGGFPKGSETQQKQEVLRWVALRFTQPAVKLIIKLKAEVIDFNLERE